MVDERVARDVADTRHANNVHFARWFESARIRYTETLDLPADDLKNLLAGKGVGIILKDLSIKYKAPVLYPDTVSVVLALSSPYASSATSSPSLSSFSPSHLLTFCVRPRSSSDGLSPACAIT